MFSLKAQNDSIVIFTQQTCGNCKQSKAFLEKNELSFTEYSLGNHENAQRMLLQVRAYGYKGRLGLPIIFLNDMLMYPAIMGADSLEHLPLKHTLDSILDLSYTGQILLKEFVSPQSTRSQEVLEYSEDCELNKTPIYLVVKNFKQEDEAKTYLSALKQKGYSNAGMLFHQNFYRVYEKFFYEKDVAEDELARQRQQKRMVYLLYL